MIFLAFLAVVGAGLWVWRRQLSPMRVQVRQQLEAARKLTDNDTQLIEAWAFCRAGFYGAGAVLVAAAVVSLPVVARGLGAYLLNVFLLGVPCAVLMAIAAVAITFVRYASALAQEKIRAAGIATGARDVHKLHTVDSKRSEVRAKFNASNKIGPLVLLGDGETQVQHDALQAARTADPWNLMGYRCSDEDRMFVLGSPGSGKTTFLMAQLIDWMQSGRSFVATDIKPEIWSILQENGLFQRFGYTAHVINPTNPNAHRFNLFAEIEDDADLNEVLSVIIPAGEGDSAVFADNARRLLKAVMSHLDKAASLPAARDFIMDAGPVSDLLTMLEESPKRSVKRIAAELKNTAGNDRLMASIMTAMGRAFEFMDDDRIADAISSSDFSMRDVLTKPRQAVFLQFEQKYRGSLATLFGGTVAYVLRLLQATAPERDDPVFVALDELMNAAPIPKLGESLNTMRSAKMPLGMYMQSTEGLNRVYGPGAAELFMGASDLRVVFKIGDNATAEYISTQLGDTEQRSYSENSSATRGQSHGPTGAGVTAGASSSQGYSSSTTRLFDPAEVLALDPGKAVVIYKGWGARFSMPRYDKDYPATLRASRDPRPQTGFRQADQQQEPQELQAAA